MDRENKYYGIIENLVRNHKKFSGLEDIIDDIIDDVYTHSQAIIESINDESVIDGYLNKVVSTSIITVPKRLNFHNESSKPTQFYAKPVKTLEQIVQEQELYKVTESQIHEPEPLAEEKDIIQEEVLEENNDDALASLIAEEDIPKEEDAINLEPEEIEPEEENVSANNTFVDKMINSITEDTLKENRLSEDEPEVVSDEELEEILPVADEEEIIEEPVNYYDVSTVEDLSDLQVEDVTETEESDTLDIVAKENNDKVVENIFTDDEDENEESEEMIQDLDQNTNIDILEEESEDTDSKNDILANSEDENDLEILDFSEPQEVEEQIGFAEEDTFGGIEEEDLFAVSNEEQDLEEDIEPVISDADDSIGFIEENEEGLLEPDNIMDITLESENPDSDLMMSAEGEVEKEEEANFVSVNYSAFEYNPDEKGNYYENDDIATKLLDIDKQEPDLNILKIFDLKYKQNLTIEEIMAELNLEKQEVIAALDKMVELI